MAVGQVGRPPKGRLAQEQSETAKRAYVAARLAGRSDQGFLDGLGVALNRSALSRAGRRLLWRPRGYKPRGRAPTGEKPEPRSAARTGPLREWLHVDARALDITAGLVVIECGSKRSQREAYRDLRGITGVVQVMQLVRAGGKHRLAALVLADGEDDRQRLRDRLDEVGGEWSWEEIASQTVAPALKTWERLARMAADGEGLGR